MNRLAYLNLFSKFLKHIRAFFRYGKISYSQEGEDLLLSRLFEKETGGFYIDIGAHHPYRFSNTYLFYLKGWTGINIDAMPGSMNAFKKHRANDINLEIPVLEEKSRMTYYQFDEPALNGFSDVLSKERNETTKYKIINEVELEGLPLSEILEKHLPKEIIDIDFMSVDVEGLDLQVLKSNNWDTFRPKVLLVELLNNSLDSMEEDPVYLFLSEKKYIVFAKCIKTVFFISLEYKNYLKNK
jgi:FkbM family methyltransferase